MRTDAETTLFTITPDLLIVPRRGVISPRDPTVAEVLLPFPGLQPVRRTLTRPAWHETHAEAVAYICEVLRAEIAMLRGEVEVREGRVRELEGDDADDRS